MKLKLSQFGTCLRNWWTDRWCYERSKTLGLKQYVQFCSSWGKMSIVMGYQCVIYVSHTSYVSYKWYLVVIWKHYDIHLLLCLSVKLFKCKSHSVMPYIWQSAISLVILILNSSCILYDTLWSYILLCCHIYVIDMSP